VDIIKPPAKLNVTLYTDASFKEGKAGLHVYIKSNEGKIEHSEAFECTDNNIAEIHAIEVGLKIIEGITLNPDVLVCCDNRAAIAWSKQQGHRVKWVRGHRRNWMNNRCDRYARKVRTK
tara:strand:- start:5006 stop:5362 length:357 start_codon:yes stop_codon:yes gene_type:complete